MTHQLPAINIHKGIPEKLERIRSLANRFKTELSIEEQAIILPLLREKWKAEKQVLDFTTEILKKLGGSKIAGHLASNFDTQILDAIANGETPEDLLESVFWQH